MDELVSTFGITPAYDVLLRGSEGLPVGLYHLHMATAEQLRRLHCGRGSIQAVKAKLLLLEKRGYVQHDALKTKAARPSYYYVMNTAGMSYLKRLGLDVNPSFRASKEIHEDAEFIEHTLEINDVLIAATLLNKLDSGYYTHGFLHERSLKQRPCCFTWQGKRWKVIPDAFLQFYHGTRRLPLLLEHDRATEWQVAFRKKVRSYIGMLQTRAYIERFKVGTIMIGFTTFKGEARRDQMRQWTREELKAQGVPSFSDRFLFTTQCRPPDPRHVWLEPCWYPPTDEQPLSLLGV